MNYVIPVAEQRFELKLDGPALADHSIDVEDIGPSLIALSEALQRVQIALYPESHPVGLKISATKPGSFALDLLLTERIDGAVAMLSLPKVVALGTGVTITAGIIASFKKAVGFLKWLGGKAIRETRDAEDGSITVVASDGSTTIVNSQVYVLVQDREFREKFRDSLAPLSKNGVNSMTFDGSGESETVSTTDLPAFEVEEDPGVTLLDQTREAYLQLTSISFKPGSKWRFSEGEGAVFYAAMDDKDFEKQIEDSRVAFAKSDILRVDLRTIQRRIGAMLSLDHRVVKVHDVIRGSRQVELPYEY